MVLDFQGIEVAQAESGEDGLDLIAAVDPAIVVLDVNLPGIDGLEVCRRLRARGDRRPVLMLTARHEVADRVDGLDAGADDYLPKPFALDELLARVRAMLRRADDWSGAGPDPEPVGEQLRLDDLSIDVAARQVTRAGRPIELTKLEFDLIELLVANAGIVLARDTIYERIWGYDEELSSNTLEVFISSLRRKLEAGDGRRLIHTIRGVGYVARPS